MTQIWKKVAVFVVFNTTDISYFVVRKKLSLMIVTSYRLKPHTSPSQSKTKANHTKIQCKHCPF